MKRKTLCCLWLALALTGASIEFVAAAADARSVAVPTAAAPLPRDSLYHLQAQLVDQNGHVFAWGAQRGQPVLVSMFYTSCQYVCPMLVESIKATQAQLTPAEREHLQILMVTLDPLHDSVQVLKQTATQRQIDDPHWQLARTDAGQVRKIAALLGVQYRDLGNGDFNHSTAVLLLDAQGRVVGRTSQLGSADAAFVQRVKTNLQAAMH